MELASLDIGVKGLSKTPTYESRWIIFLLIKCITKKAIMMWYELLLFLELWEASVIHRRRDA